MSNRSVFLIHPAGGFTLLPPVKFSPNQITAGPFTSVLMPNGAKLGFSCPQEEFDLHTGLLDKIPGAAASDVLVLWMHDNGVVPRNIARFAGRKVLIVQDTQYGQALTLMLRYLSMERFDVVFVEKRHHAHWFSEIGVPNVHWLPSIFSDPIVRPLPLERRPEIVCVGHVNKNHARRRVLLAELMRHNYPVRHITCPPAELPDQYNRALISLNISLNGDANMRFYEVPAAGGFLLTDRLSDLAGVDCQYRDGEHYVTYTDTEDLCRKLDHYLAHPEAAVAIAARGQAHYLATLNRAVTLERFWRVVDTGADEPAFRLTLEPRFGRRQVATLDYVLGHLSVYLAMQDVNREIDGAKVLVLPGTSNRLVVDCADLHRTTIYLLDDDERSGAEAQALGLTSHVRRMALADARTMSWAAVAGRSGGALDPSSFQATRTLTLS